MTDKEILEKAISLAIDGGYSVPEGQKIISLYSEWITYTSKRQKEYSEQVANLIFNHDFAKALWPRGHCGLQEELNHDDFSRWIAHHLYHLQQMVIADDPIKYLGDNI